MSGWPRTATLALLALLSAVAFGLLAAYFAVGEGRLDFTGHARGRDFVNLWTAGRLIGEHRVSDIFHPARFMAAHHRLFAPTLPFHFWSYPPPALLLAAPFALAPGYVAALGAWSAAGLLALAPAARAALGRGGAEFALLMLCPAVAVNLGLGQNGALSAALLMGGLALLDRRPWAAGALLGLLVFKPQIALLLPVMVLAGRRWRVMGGALLSAAAVLALSTAIFGVQSWRDFVDGALPMQSLMLRQGRGPFMAMMPSTFMAGRTLGLPWTWALAAQLPLAALGVWVVWRAWRDGRSDTAGRAALLGAATFLATPQAFNYDLIPTAFAVLVLLRPPPASEPSVARPRGARRALATFDAALALAAWALPAAMIALGEVRLPLAPLVLTALVLRLAQREGALWPAAPPATRAASASPAGEAASHT